MLFSCWEKITIFVVMRLNTTISFYFNIEKVQVLTRVLCKYHLTLMMVEPQNGLMQSSTTSSSSEVSIDLSFIS